MSTRTRGGYVHHALFYDSTDALLTSAVPFLRAGLDGGEDVVLVCRERNNALLADPLDADPRIIVIRQANVYTGIPNAVATYRRMMRRHEATPGRVRLLGEVNFGSEPATWDEWMRFEAIVNVALAPYPLSSVCAYDTRGLPDRVLTGAQETHPLVLTSATVRRNGRYIPTTTFLAKHRAIIEPDPLEMAQPTHVFSDLTNPAGLVGLRQEFHDAPALYAVPAMTRTDLVTAVAEVAANGLGYGRPPVVVRLWVSATKVLCTVTDQGPGFDNPLAGYTPVQTDDPHHAGAGLWLARQCCDQLDAIAGPDGFTVRLGVMIPDAASAAREFGGASARAEVAERRARKAQDRAERLQRRFDQLDSRLHEDRQPRDADPLEMG